LTIDEDVSIQIGKSFPYYRYCYFCFAFIGHYSLVELFFFKSMVIKLITKGSTGSTGVHVINVSRVASAALPTLVVVEKKSKTGERIGAIVLLKGA